MFVGCSRVARLPAPSHAGVSGHICAGHAVIVGCRGACAQPYALLLRIYPGPKHDEPLLSSCLHDSQRFNSIRCASRWAEETVHGPCVTPSTLSHCTALQLGAAEDEAPLTLPVNNYHTTSAFITTSPHTFIPPPLHEADSPPPTTPPAHPQHWPSV